MPQILATSCKITIETCQFQVYILYQSQVIRSKVCLRTSDDTSLYGLLALLQNKSSSEPMIQNRPMKLYILDPFQLAQQNKISPPEGATLAKMSQIMWPTAGKKQAIKIAIFT